MNGSVSRTGIADQFGCKSQVMSITASLTMLLIVLFGTPVLEYLPVPILTGIVVAALIGITEFGLAVKLWKTDHTEFAIFVGAFLGVLLFGTIYGVVIGVILSFIAVIVKAVEPPRAFLGVIPGQEGFYSLNRYRNVKKIKGAVIYRFNGALFFANINTFVDDIEKNIDADTKWVIVEREIRRGNHYDFISPAICIRSFIASPVPALPPNSFAACIRIIVTPIPLINPPITGVDM